MSVKKVAKFLRLKQLTALINFNSTVTLNGNKFTIPVIKNMGLLNLSVKEDWFFHLLKFIEPATDSSFVDVGVNVGQSLLAFRSLYKNAYWGFEPNPNCDFYLNNLINSNGFKNTNILPIGLSDENRLAKFYTKSNADSAGTMIKELRPGFYHEELVSYIPLFSFDELDLPEIGAISLIKIDVEGAELEVISGLLETLKKHRPIVICEILDCHSEESMASMQTRADKLIALVQNTDYNTYRIIHEVSKISFKKITALTLRLWTAESWNLNDYIFIPKEREQPENITIPHKN